MKIFIAIIILLATMLTAIFWSRPSIMEDYPKFDGELIPIETVEPKNEFFIAAWYKLDKELIPLEITELEVVTASYFATVTAYNTTVEQTDGNSCITASGADICGRNDAIACPRAIPFHTWVEIGGKQYECLDRTALKYDGRFDISFDKDVEGAVNWGKQTKKVRVIQQLDNL